MTLVFPALLVNATGEFLRVPSRSNILWFCGMYDVFIVVSGFSIVLLENLTTPEVKRNPHTVNLIFLLAAHKA